MGGKAGDGRIAVISERHLLAGGTTVFGVPRQVKRRRQLRVSIT
jgi:hypothetical protein